MRIVHVNTAKSWRGGEVQCLHLMQGLAALGDEVCVITQPGSPLAARAAAAGLEVIELAMGAALDRASGPRIREHLAARPTDIVHAHTSHAHTHARRAVRAMRTRAPRLVVTRHVAYSIFRHGVLRLNRRKYVDGVDRIICVSSAVRAQLVADGIPGGLLQVIHNGAPPEAFDEVAPASEAEAAYDRTRGRLLSIGALTPEKGHAQVLEALSEVLTVHPKARYVVAGEGRERAALEAQAARLGIADHVAFVGFVEDPRSWIAAAEVVIVPSRSEGFSLALLEAMCQGAAILTTAAGGMADLVRPEQEAALMPLDDPSATAARIAELLDHPATRDQLGSQARRRAENDFTVARMVEQTRALYSALL